MILDIIKNLHRYEPIHPLLALAERFLRNPGIQGLPAGRHEIDGNAIYAIVVRDQGCSRDNAKLEIHNNYIDIQVILSGTESIGWKPRSSCIHPAGCYDSKKDLQFFTDQPDDWIQIHPGQFAIFFPEDAHAPMVSQDLIHKVVIKVAVISGV